MSRFAPINHIRRFTALVIFCASAVGIPDSRAASTDSGTPIDPNAVQEIFRAVMTVESEVAADARTAQGLGRERRGAGVVVDGDGLVLTIGYLILEATSVTLTDIEGRRIPATIVAYDHETGFGLVRALLPLDVTPIELGSSDAITPGDPVLALSHGGPHPLTPQRVVDRRPFAGYWEYLLENAIFTSPPHPGYGGAPLIDLQGKLVGIGSLYIGDALRDDPPMPGNMFVPIDLLPPILADLLENGRRTGPAQPWLGVNISETGGRVFVTRVMDGSPAESAGIKRGDIIMGVDGRTVHGMVDFFRKVRGQGDAGTEIPIDVLSAESTDMSIDRRTIRSRNRINWLNLEKGL